MKNLFFALPAAGSLLAFVTSCHHEVTGELPPCPSGEVATTAIPGWGGNPYCFGARVEQAGQFQTYVINSQAELQAVSHCPDSLSIDFSRYTLLAGKTKTVACNYLVSQRVEASCEGLVYHVVVGPGACQAPSEALYATLVPKQPANARIVFDVQVR